MGGSVQKQEGVQCVQVCSAVCVQCAVCSVVVRQQLEGGSMLFDQFDIPVPRHAFCAICLRKFCCRLLRRLVAVGNGGNPCSGRGETAQVAMGQAGNRRHNR